MRPLFLAVAFMLGCACNALAEEPAIPADQAVIHFDTKLGVVTFNHQMHADLSFTQCTSCHHTWEPGETIKTCHACHETKAGESPAAKTAFHTRCIGCHEYTVGKGEPAGPQKKMCKLCHIK
jgi:DnaJ-class molecular chaperone